MNRLKPQPRKLEKRHALKFEGERGRSRTRQSFKVGCTVDAILRQYETLGVDTQAIGVFKSNVARMPFGVSPDATGDYVSMLNRVRAVELYFKGLPSGIRESFDNSPANMVSWLSDPKNRDEAIKLGILPDPKAGKASAEPQGASSTPAKGSDTTPPPNKGL